MPGFLPIKGKTILQIGDDKKILRFLDDQTQVIDLKGAFVYPGFVDSHTHPFALGEKMGTVDLTGVNTEAAAVDMIVRKALTTPKGEWIAGIGFDEGAWANALSYWTSTN